MSELVVIEQTSALQVFTEGAQIDPILAAIREQATAFTPDLTTVKGRKEIASMANKVARSKTYLDDIGKELVAQYKLIPAKIDANRKLIRDELDRLKAEVRKPLTDWENAEEARVKDIKDRIEVIRQHGFMTEDSRMIASAIERVESAALDESFDEFTDEAEAMMNRVLADLRHKHAVAVKQEAEAAELARLREEQIKREQVEREARIAAEAAAKARKDAEDKAAREKAEAERKAKAERDAAERRELELKLAAEKAERARLEQIERAKQEKAAAVEAERKRHEAEERKRQEEIARVNAEADRRAADKQNRQNIHLRITDVLKENGVPDKHAATVVSLLSSGSIPHVTVKY